MNKHRPTMDVQTLFEGVGPNSPGRFCTTCGFRMENSIHCISLEYRRLEKLAEKPLDNTWTERDWQSANYEFLQYKIDNGYEDYPEIGKE